jgi:hypothetical protein
MFILVVVRLLDAIFSIHGFEDPSRVASNNITSTSSDRAVKGPLSEGDKDF